jgi:hypothetical protein
MGPGEVVQAWLSYIMVENDLEASYQLISPRIKEEYTYEKYEAKIKRKVNWEKAIRDFRKRYPNISEEDAKAIFQAILDTTTLHITKVEMKGDTEALVHFQIQVLYFTRSLDVGSPFARELNQIQKSSEDSEELYKMTKRFLRTYAGAPKVISEEIEVVKEEGKWYLKDF